MHPHVSLLVWALYLLLFSSAVKRSEYMMKVCTDICFHVNCKSIQRHCLELLTRDNNCTFVHSDNVNGV